MRTFRLLALLTLALYATAQAPQLLPIWTGQSYTFARLGPTLVLNNGQLDALPQPALIRHTDTLLSYDAAAGGWTIPPAAQGRSVRNLVIYVNGLRYHSGEDYAANGGILKALHDNMQPTYLVTCDYDEQ